MTRTWCGGVVAICMMVGTAFGASDAERRNSQMMNARQYAGRLSAEGGVRILFLGNSITLHGPLAEIGWTNNWGMAASSQEKDYVHLVTRGIEGKTGRKADVQVLNLADFERHYRTWNPSANLKDEIAFDPDYLIVAVGENAPDLTTAEDRLAYRKAFKGLLGAFMDGRTERPNVVVRGVFWPNPAKNFEMAHVASDYAVPFVRADLSGDAAMTAAGLFAHGGVAGHPGDKGMAAIAGRILEGLFPTESGYEAWMDGRPVAVRPIRVSAVPFNQWGAGYQRPVDQTEVAGLIAVEIDGRTAFRIRPKRPFSQAVVRPLSAGIRPVCSNGEIGLTVEKPGHYVLELDGQHCPLEIFAEPRRDFAKERAEANVVFGPGLHEPKVVTLKSHDRVYIDRDAVVLGSFQMTGVEDVRISGYGVISGARNRRTGDNCYREGMASAVRIIDSKGISIDGPIVLDSACWMVEAFNSSDLDFSRLKVTGAWRYNTDGIDVCNCRNVSIRDCYVHSFDDSIVIKGIWPDGKSPVEDIRVERCVCWCSWGRTLEIGLETWAPRFRGISFRDCDLIHNCGGALSVHLGGPAAVEDVLYRDIRIEYDKGFTAPVLQESRDAKYSGKGPWSGEYIRIENARMFQPGSLYAGTPGFPDPAKEPLGTVRNLRFENIAVTVEPGAVRPGVHVKAEPGSSFGEIKAENITVNGEPQAVFAAVDIDALCPPRPETAATFKAGAYPPPARPYREAAKMAYRYMTSLPAMTALVETGKPNQKYQHNAYVSKTHTAHIKAMLDWAKLEPEKRGTAMRFAKASAEFLLQELEPRDAPLAWWPPTYGRKPLEFDPKTDGPYKKMAMIGNEPEGAVKYRGEVMLLYPADVGTAFVDYWRATQDGRFLDAARGIAETYLKTRRADGSWPLKMKLATGETVGENTLVPTYPLDLFEKLSDATHDPKWRKAADGCFAWLEAHPLTDWNWDGQFEDIKPEKPYKNPTKHNAVDTMLYMLKRFPGDKARLATCRRILDFCEKRFVVWAPPKNHSSWPAPSVLEQYSCFTPIDASAAKMIRAYVAMYKTEGRSEDLAKARALADAVTRVQKPSGRIPTFWEGVNTGDSGLSDERYDWLNCMAASAEALIELSEAIGESASPADRTDWPVLKTYEGECLRRIKMPLGGIGTGTVSLSGTGGLVDWEIMGTPNKGYTPSLGGFSYVSPFFAIRTESPDGEVKARILEGPVNSDEYEGQSGSRARNHGFARWRGCTFRAAYPLAQVALADDAMPVKATLEAMNPLIPGDPDRSGIPAALLRWKVTNVSAAPLKASLLCFLLNPAQGNRHVARVAQGDLAGVRLGAEGGDPVKAGEIALVLPKACGEITSATAFGALHWMSGFDGIWRQFVASGKAEDYAAGQPSDSRDKASVAVAFELQPGETKTLPFALAWRFAHRYAWAKTADGKPADVGNWYATRYPTAIAAAQDLLANLGKYEAGTVAFVESVLARNAPDVVKEAALFNLSTLRTETCFRAADGHFFAWEGCFDKAGVCEGNCTHVWGYEHALVDLWPSLAKDMTELQFGPAMDERGCMKFRLALPLDANAKPPRWAAADGQMQCIVKAYENWKETGDDAWMRRLYPRIRKAMEFAWVENGWDGDRDGVMEGCQHNTMDVEYFGPNPQMEFLYLAALKAMAALADGADDAAFAAECRALAVKGSAWTEQNLFNGDYYEHKVVPMTAAPADGTYPKNVPDPANPVYQLAAGCLVDQLVGDYAARAVGLGPVADERNAKKTLDTILARNASANVAASFGNMRSFALPEEPALKMAWYPKGRMPPKPFPYYSETMTGFEYVVAANLAQRGDFARAEQVVRDIRSRYDGRKRNPFDEAECGHHYARALAAWSVLEAFQIPQD